MCGITGYWISGGELGIDSMRERILAMTATLRHRGPDSGGAWIDPRAGLAFGHRRLSIRDLSPAGHQPMSTPDGRFVLCYNGEIYNAEELRDELRTTRQMAFRGTSDTEVILHGCAAWGVKALAERIIGMFAFAFWNAAERTLTLVRDRIGIKPLYWSNNNGVFAFASELKALRRLYGSIPSEGLSVDRDAVAGLMRYSYIPAPYSIYRGVFKLGPGCLLEIGANGEPRTDTFWDGRAVFREGVGKRFGPNDEAAAEEELELLLRDAVKRRMVSDVPLGAFLSGGIDSSLVTALMQAQSDRPIRTFSIGFDEKIYNEAEHAKRVAGHLGTSHTEQYMTPRDVWDIIPRMPEFYDEPFADSSQLPTYLLSHITRKHVTVALSGDGGDELFSGYPRYHHPMTKLAALPGWLLAIMKAGVCLPPPSWWDRLAGLLPARYVPANHRKGFGKELRDRFGRLNADFLGNYRAQMSVWPNAAALVPGARDIEGVFADRSLVKDSPEPTDWMQYLDAMSYLVDDILVKVDRASMAVSLEVRVPILDHRVFAFAWRLPLHMRVCEGKTKWLLRKILYKYVPKELIDRPKMGFTVPVLDWLRGPMRGWAEALIDPARLGREGYLEPILVADAWRRLQEGEKLDNPVWSVLMFQAWLERHGGTAEQAVAISDDVQVEVAGETAGRSD